MCFYIAFLMVRTHHVCGFYPVRSFRPLYTWFDVAFTVLWSIMYVCMYGIVCVYVCMSVCMYVCNLLLLLLRECFAISGRSSPPMMLVFSKLFFICSYSMSLLFIQSIIVALVSPTSSCPFHSAFLKCMQHS